jgi:hypothetical protein
VQIWLRDNKSGEIKAILKLKAGENYGTRDNQFVWSANYYGNDFTGGQAG